MMGLNFDYDPMADSLFLWCQKDYHYDYSFTVDDDVLMDMDENGLPVAFEFLNASNWFDMDKEYFNLIKDIKIHVEINDKFICLNADLVVLKKTSHIYRIRTNLDNFPSNNYEFGLAN